VRLRVQETIESIFEEELEAALGAERYERTTPRQGYRNGRQRRQVLTEQGPQELQVPRARLFRPDGGTQEWHSELLPRYQRRTRKVDEAILGCYLAGANSRRIRRALRPLWGEGLLSRSSISRIVARLKEHFEAWRSRDLNEEDAIYLYLDGTYLAVRLARRVVRVPVQAVLGVREDGQKVLLSLGIAARESTASWKAVVEDLSRRGLSAPALVIVDGNAGLSRAIRECWPTATIQRCTKHKLENLKAKAPRHAQAELKRDYDAIIYGDSEAKALAARDRFVRKWSLLSKEVVRCLEEAGEELLSFYRFPQSQWKCLRTTNPLERLNGEFRRRTKTQGSFPHEEAALILLYGLFAGGQIRLRKIDGYQDMRRVSWNKLSQVA
jgi:transposase-like protein